MIRVLVADDYEDVRRGVTQILDDAPDIVIAGEASTGREVLQALREHEYDVLLLDLAMPEPNGFGVLKQLQDLKPEQRVLILTIHPEEQYCVRSMKAGAHGYLTKDRASDELIAAIRKVAQGGNYFTPLPTEEQSEISAEETDDEMLGNHPDRE